MTDDEYIAKSLQEEIRGLKEIGRSARCKKNGSKTKRRAMLPSDYLTTRQWKERNGGVVVYNLNKPMTWSEFKNLPKDLMSQYVSLLREKYSINQVALGDMLKVSQNTIGQCLKSNNISGMFAHGKRMTPDQKARFGEFLCGVCDDYIVNDASENITYEEIKHHSPTDDPNGCQCKENMRMSTVTLTFEGPFDPVGVLNTLKYISKDGENVVMTIHLDINS